MTLLRKLNINQLYYNYVHLINRALLRYIEMINIVSTHIDSITNCTEMTLRLTVAWRKIAAAESTYLACNIAELVCFQRVA